MDHASNGTGVTKRLWEIGDIVDAIEAWEAKEMAIPISDTPHAPFIFYENAPAFGFTNGIINLTLSANRTWLGSDGGVVNDQVVIAYLRENILAALSLRQALDNVLLLAAPTPEGKAN